MKNSKGVSWSTTKNTQRLYGDSAHYWPVDVLPFFLAAACVNVVLEESEKADLIYQDAKRVFGMSALSCLCIKIYLNHFGVAHTRAVSSRRP